MIQPAYRRIVHHRSFTRSASIALLWLLVGSLLAGATAPAQASGTTGYRDFSYVGTTAPTGQKPQSKLWFNDGRWWGGLFNSSTKKFHIYWLDWATQKWNDTGTVVEDRSNASGDFLWDGTHLFVASAGTSSTNSSDSGRVRRFSYNSTTKSYTLDQGYPVTAVPGGMEAIVFDKDTTGTLWVTYTRAGKVYVTHSTTDHRTWVTPYVLPVAGASNVTSDDISTVVAYNGKIGIFWSNQTDWAFYFATHKDGDPDTTWTVETAHKAPEQSDDHINIKSIEADPSGRIFAAVKTSLNASNDPLILLLVLQPDGKWDTDNVFGVVSNDHTRAIVMLDSQNRDVYMFAAAPCCSGGVIYKKQAKFDDLAKGNPFPAGMGEPFIQSSTDTTINSPTSTKQSVNASTGLVVMAGDDNTRYYLHNSIALGMPDTTPPTATLIAPADGATLSGSATLTAEATDDVGVVRVDFLVDGAVVGSDPIAPYSVSWDSSSVADGSHSIVARAVDTGSNTTSSASRTVTIDNPINTTITGGPTGTVASSSATFTFSANETGATFACSLDNAAFSACSSPKEYTGLADGAHSFQVRAVDAAGNVDATPATRSWTIDTSVPITVIAEADARVESANPSLNYGTATSLAVDTSPNTESYLRFTVTGVSGSVQSAKLRLYAFGGTKDGPKVHGTSNAWAEAGTTGITWGTKPAPIGSATDDKGAVSTNTWAEFDVTSLVSGNGTYSFVLVPTSSDGMDMRSREAASNKPELVITAKSGGTTDTTPPDTTITGGPTGTVTSNSASFTFSSTETNSTFACSLDNAAFSACSSPKEYTGLADAAHSFQVRAVDAAGNVDATPATRSWTIDTSDPDTTPPTATLTAPTNGATLSGSATLTAEATDDVGVARVDFLVDNTVVGSDTTAPYSVSWNSSSVADGSHSIVARAIDGAANSTSSASHSVTVDNPPDTSITGGPTGTVTSNSASFTFSSTETNSTFACSLDNAAFSACSSPKEYTGLADGAHSFQVQAIDAAGNVDATPATRSWTIDTSVPITVIAEADARVESANPSLNYGTATSLAVDTSPNTESYLRFTVTGVSGSVQSAKLRLYAFGGTADGPRVYGTSNAWTEAGTTGITWGTKPAAVGTHTDDKGAVSVNTWVEFEVTSLVSGNGTYSFVLVPTSSDGVDIYSRETTTTYKPQLVIRIGSTAP